MTIETQPCAGMNCGTTTYEHSPDCYAEHAATIAGGTFVKRPLTEVEGLAALSQAGFHCRDETQKRLMLEVVNAVESAHRIGAKAPADPIPSQEVQP